MGHNDHIDFELSDRIHHFIDEGYFESDVIARGIALFVADNSVSSLSAKQRVIWGKVISPILANPINAEEHMEQVRDDDREAELRHFASEASNPENK